MKLWEVTATSCSSSADGQEPEAPSLLTHAPRPSCSPSLPPLSAAPGRQSVSAGCNVRACQPTYAREQPEETRGCGQPPSFSCRYRTRLLLLLPCGLPALLPSLFLFLSLPLSLSLSHFLF